MIYLLAGLSLQKVETTTQRLASPMEDSKGKWVLDEP